MARDPMRVLERVRQALVAEAGAELAAALALQERHNYQLQERRRRLEQEAATAGPEDAVAFSRWLPEMRRRIAKSNMELEQAASGVEHLRAELAARRAEAEAVGTALRKRAEYASLVRGRIEQGVLDEAGAQLLRRHQVSA